MMRLALVPAFVLAAALIGAPASAEDNPACAKFEEPLAYNACLARLGPPAHATKGVPASPEDYGQPQAAAGGRVHGGLVVAHERRGRVRLEFDVGPRGGARPQ